MANLDKLNRLRVNAGKTELKAWKASQAKLEEQIKALEDAGFTDVLPGANTAAQPITNDPEVAAARAEPDPPPSIEDSALAKHIDNTPPVERKPATTTKAKAHLARGLDTDPYARQSRERVRDLREKEKAEEAKKKSSLKKGQVDSKKDPEKAKRQEKHIAEKRAQREKEGKLKPVKEKDPNKVTAADLAREIDMDPKVARAKLRRHADKIQKIVKDWDGSWEFPKKAAEDIKKILRSEK